MKRQAPRPNAATIGRLSYVVLVPSTISTIDYFTETCEREARTQEFVLEHGDDAAPGLCVQGCARSAFGSSPSAMFRSTFSTTTTLSELRGH